MMVDSQKKPGTNPAKGRALYEDRIPSIENGRRRCFSRRLRSIFTITKLYVCRRNRLAMHQGNEEAFHHQFGCTLFNGCHGDGFLLYFLWSDCVPPSRHWCFVAGLYSFVGETESPGRDRNQYRDHFAFIRSATDES